MKSQTTIRALIGALLAAGALGASAQHAGERGVYPHDSRYDQRDDDDRGRGATPRIDRVQAEQAELIDRGLRHGALTRVEARHLRRQQFEIVRLKQRALHDGQVTGDERRELRELQARAGHDIQRALHNARDDDRRYGRG